MLETSHFRLDVLFFFPADQTSKQGSKGSGEFWCLTRLFSPLSSGNKLPYPLASETDQLKVTGYHVRCLVVSRYAVTTVQSSVWNQLSVTKEAAFEVDLPSSAFISNFTMYVSPQVPHVHHTCRNSLLEKTSVNSLYFFFFLSG